MWIHIFQSRGQAQLPPWLPDRNKGHMSQELRSLIPQAKASARPLNDLWITHLSSIHSSIYSFNKHLPDPCSEPNLHFLILRTKGWCRDRQLSQMVLTVRPSHNTTQPNWSQDKRLAGLWMSDSVSRDLLYEWRQTEVLLSVCDFVCRVKMCQDRSPAGAYFHRHSTPPKEEHSI